MPIKANAYNTTLSTLFDAHAPTKTKTIRAKPINKWFTPALSKLKSARRHIERLWLRTRSPNQLKLFRIATNKYHSAIIDAKKCFNASFVASCSGTANPRNVYSHVYSRRQAFD